MFLSIPHTTGPSTRPGLLGFTEGASLVLAERARRHEWAGEGALSLKTFLHGKAHYRVDGRSYTLQPAQFLVLNRGQAYRVSIEEKTPTQSFCIFFARDLAAQVRHASHSPHSALLDRPVPVNPSPVHFFEKPYPLTGKVQQYLLGLQSRLHATAADPGILTESLHGLLYELLLLDGDTRREMDALQFVRSATREELYRRLHVAREYICACSHTPLTLQELAEVACLSPNHLLRTFRQLFGQSPFEMISRVRLEKAASLLKATDGPVIEICTAVGFQSLSTFTGLFKRRYGVPPHGYRRQKR